MGFNETKQQDVFFGSFSIFPGGGRQAQTTKGATTRQGHEYSTEILHLLKQHREVLFMPLRIIATPIYIYIFIFHIFEKKKIFNQRREIFLTIRLIDRINFY